MSALSPLAVLSVLLVVVSSSWSVMSAPSTTSYIGTATCNFTMQQSSVQVVGNTPQAGVQTQGYFTINLTAGAYAQPNTPGLPAGATFLEYPIIQMAGTRKAYNLTGLVLSTNSILGIGLNRTLFSTFDPASANIGYLSDPGYSNRFDYTGISILTDSTQFPTIQYAQVNSNANLQYSELALWATGEWTPSSLNIFTCTSNYTVAAVVTPIASPSSTGSSDPTGPTTPPSAVGDPSFTGFLGQHYQVHGMADTVYNIISDRLVQLNAQFVFLNGGQCPVVDGKPLTNCWSHPGSYFGSLALKTAEGDRLLITAGSHTDGLTVALNEQPLTASVNRAGLSVSVDNSFRVLIEAGLYSMVVENSDMFVNLAGIRVTDWQRLKEEVQPHGLLGQTWQGRHRTAAIEGTVDDYAEADNALFGSQFLYSKFGKQ